MGLVLGLPGSCPVIHLFSPPSDSEKPLENVLQFAVMQVIACVSQINDPCKFTEMLI